MNGLVEFAHIGFCGRNNHFANRGLNRCIEFAMNHLSFILFFRIGKMIKLQVIVVDFQCKAGRLIRVDVG